MSALSLYGLASLPFLVSPLPLPRLCLLPPLLLPALFLPPPCLLLLTPLYALNSFPPCRASSSSTPPSLSLRGRAPPLSSTPSFLSDVFAPSFSVLTPLLLLHRLRAHPPVACFTWAVFLTRLPLSPPPLALALSGAQLLTVCFALAASRLLSIASPLASLLPVSIRSPFSISSTLLRIALLCSPLPVVPFAGALVPSRLVPLLLHCLLPSFRHLLLLCPSMPLLTSHLTHPAVNALTTPLLKVPRLP